MDMSWLVLALLGFFILDLLLVLFFVLPYLKRTKDEASKPRTDFEADDQ